MIVKKCCGVHALRIAVGITMLALLLAGSANAATLTVCPSGCAYSSIQKAINASSNGDIVLVQSGTYFENVNITKQLTLRGIGNPVVDAGGSGSAITLAANGITLEGFTATHSSFDGGAGIVVNSNNNTLTGNNASSNTENGIYLKYSSNNTLGGNNVLNNQKGIYQYDSSNNKIYNNIFKNNNNFDFYESNINTWNTTRQSGTNIIGGQYLGGNFWANPEGTGFSQTCPDVNGDGICDKSYTLGENNTDYLPLAKDKIPPKSVRNLKNVSFASSYINWTWKDPKDIDFKKVMVFIDSKFKKNVSKSKRFFNATNLKANTRHTISTRTVDMNGNINKTWKNSSAWTAK
ncbi:MAG: right-handed parallel beta-helix repeat-containing protein [Candidatus Methanoperedens sp.]|nr:right-handed parallel beta-helix repeat-containing protein [Candidatus Methanoperedens sp.]